MLKPKKYFKKDGKHPMSKEQKKPQEFENPVFKPHIAPDSLRIMSEMARTRASRQRDALDLDCIFGQ